MKENSNLMDSLDESRMLFRRIAERVHDDLKERHPAREYELLAVLRHLGRAKLKEIAEHIGSKPLVCLRLGVLERKKFVARELDETDRRNVFYHIAPDGEKFMKAASDDIRKSLRKILDPLGCKEADCLASAIRKVNGILEKVV
jgi:DNA-binding MarR family transcriptional regulator